VVTEAARQIIGSERSFTSFSIDGNGGQAALVSLPDREAESSQAAARLGAVLDEQVCVSNRPLRLTQAELASHPVWRQATSGEPATPPRGWLAVPMQRRDGRNLGVTRVADKADGELGDDDQAVLVQLAHMASQAISNFELRRERLALRGRQRALAVRLVHVEEGQRRSLAREVLAIAQPLAGLETMLESARRDAHPADLARIAGVSGQLRERVNDLSLDLAPPMLDTMGLVPTLTWYLARYRAQSGVAVQFDLPGFNRRLPAETEITAFRIIQEALTNVARHGGVAKAAVALWTEDTWLGLRIEDEGRGFDMLSVAGQSGGLNAMAERARLIGGALTLDSQPGAGTRLVVRLPLPPEVE
jgi:signal transduction histidine kinase